MAMATSTSSTLRSSGCPTGGQLLIAPPRTRTRYTKAIPMALRKGAVRCAASEDRLDSATPDAFACCKLAPRQPVCDVHRAHLRHQCGQELQNRPMPVRGHPHHGHGGDRSGRMPKWLVPPHLDDQTGAIQWRCHE